MVGDHRSSFLVRKQSYPHLQSGTELSIDLPVGLCLSLSCSRMSPRGELTLLTYRMEPPFPVHPLAIPQPRGPLSLCRTNRTIVPERNQQGSRQGPEGSLKFRTTQERAVLLGGGVQRGILFGANRRVAIISMPATLLLFRQAFPGSSARIRAQRTVWSYFPSLRIHRVLDCSSCKTHSF